MAEPFAAYMTVHVLLMEGGVDPGGKGSRSFKWSALLEAAIATPIEGVEPCAFRVQLLFYSEDGPSATQGVVASGRTCFLPCAQDIGVPTVKVMAQTVATSVSLQPMF